MVFKKYSTKHERNAHRICNCCKQDVDEKSYVILECGHKEHLQCLKNRILTNLYNTFWDNCGIYDHYCKVPKCNGTIKHICDCHARKKESCLLCLGCPSPPMTRENIDRLNQLCIEKQIVGYRYIGKEIINEGNIQFII